MIDVRFATALQMMLTLALAQSEGQGLLSSSNLAKGLAANPSLIRKLLVPLAGAGLVSTVFGRDGGVRLTRRPEDISLADIYRAILGDSSLWQGRSVPHLCLVSTNIEDYFVKLTSEIDVVVEQALQTKTLARALAELRSMNRLRR